MVRASDSQLRESRFEHILYCVKPWANLFTLHCSSSLSCRNKFLDLDSGGYLCIVKALFAAWLNTYHGVWLNRSARVSNVKHFQQPKNSILQYVGTYLCRFILLISKSCFQQPEELHTAIYKNTPLSFYFANLSVILLDEYGMNDVAYLRGR